MINIVKYYLNLKQKKKNLSNVYIWNIILIYFTRLMKEIKVIQCMR